MTTLRAEEVAEIRKRIIDAIMALIKPVDRNIPQSEKPSIAQLEKILNSDEPLKVSIKPDGSVVEIVPSTTTVGAVADAVLSILDSLTTGAGDVDEDDFRTELETAIENAACVLGYTWPRSFVERFHLSVWDSHAIQSVLPSLRAKPSGDVADARRGALEERIKALGAAISRRDWHAAEQAHAAIRDSK